MTKIILPNQVYFHWTVYTRSTLSLTTSIKIKSDSKILYKEAKHAFVGLFFVICPSALYSDEFCLEKFGPGFENSKIKVRVSEVYPGQTAGDLNLDLKVLAINDTIKTVSYTHLTLPTNREV